MPEGHFCSTRILTGAFCVWLLGLSTEATADGGVKDVVKDLYGGQGILLAPTPPPFPNHAPHFAADSQSALNDLSTALTANIGVFSFNSTSSGFTFDPERGIPLRTEESLGPLLAERATTIGRGKFNLGFSYSRIEFSSYNGTPLDQLSILLHHDDVNGDGILGPASSPLGFELDQIRIDLNLQINQDLFAFYGTYGVTDNLDVGIVLPVVHSYARAAAHATIIRNSPSSALVHNFDPSRPPDSIIERDATGIGDVILRAKYNVLRGSEDLPDTAFVGQLTLPSGDSDNLLGTGETSGLALLVLSKRFDWFTPHLNLGYEASSWSPLNNLRYVVGADAAVLENVTIAADILGRWLPYTKYAADNFIDGAVTARWAVTGSAYLDAGIQVPLNKNLGLRPDVIWTIGGHLAF